MKFSKFDERSVLGPKRLICFFFWIIDSNIFYLKGNCVLRTLKKLLRYFLSMTDIHTHKKGTWGICPNLFCTEK